MGLSNVQFLLAITCALCLAFGKQAEADADIEYLKSFVVEISDGHEDVWAVVVSSSSTWYDYRHTSNALGFYRAIKHLGIDDEHIILMLADNMACSPMNMDQGSIVMIDGGENIYGQEIEIDYNSDSVTVKNLASVLLGFHEPQTSRRKRMMSGPKSNVVLYLTGHGGEEFLRFQTDELLAGDFGRIIGQMSIQRRYMHMLTILDTCQAHTLYKEVTANGFIGISSSSIGENSYSLHVSTDLNTGLVDQMTYCIQEYLRAQKHNSSGTLLDMSKVENYCKIYHSMAGLVAIDVDLASMNVKEFLTQVAHLEFTLKPYL